MTPSTRILTRLSTGPSYAEALHDLDIPIKALNHALISLQADGMIALSRAGYEITAAGRARA